jgi:uncharacterized protein
MNIDIREAKEEELKDLNIDSWSPWSCAVSEFDWEYDADERCYIQKGRAIIKSEDGSEVEIKSGDIVLFPKGLRCSWKVTEPIEKVYRFE